LADRFIFVENHPITWLEIRHDRQMHDTMIIGAGVAGLTVARALKNVRDVLVLEKSRGLGGRSSTRTVNGNRVGPAKIDHGAQYFTVRDERFQHQVDEWLKQGHLTIWSHGFHRLTDRGLETPVNGYPRYVFPRGMNTIGKLLSEHFEVRTQTKVTRVSKRGETWLASSETGETFEAKTLVLNMPAEQALALCQFDLGDVRYHLERVVMEPCFALMLGYEAASAPQWQGILVEIPGPISWIAHDSSKREDPKETTLVVHSTPAFAREHFNEDPNLVKEELLAALNLQSSPFNPSTSLSTSLQPPLWTDLHRWKYALASTFLDLPFLKYDSSLYFCGDWCGGARLEAAYLSGLALAQHLE
jgi:renalase